MDAYVSTFKISSALVIVFARSASSCTRKEVLVEKVKKYAVNS